MNEPSQNPPRRARRKRVRDSRERKGEGRYLAAEARERQADDRDVLAVERDQRADKRDRTADERDVTTEARDQRRAEDVVASSPESARRSEEWRGSAEGQRRAAAGDRTAAAGDRRAAADDRTAAALDRRAARQDREAELFDELTGALRRGPGYVELDRDVARARREQTSLIVAVVDMVGLKQINDTHGHQRGDQALREVVDALHATLRSYDLVVRFGGDEFLCTLPGTTLDEARRRFAAVNERLAAVPIPTSVTVGLAEMQPQDRTDDLVERADAALYRERHTSHAHPD